MLSIPLFFHNIAAEAVTYAKKIEYCREIEGHKRCGAAGVDIIISGREAFYFNQPHDLPW